MDSSAPNGSVNGVARQAQRTRNISSRAPFCWQEKQALRSIRARFEDSNKTPYALAIYLALTELASDRQCETFQGGIATIAKKAGTSYKTTLEYLRELEVLGVIHIRRMTFAGSKLDAPAFYTLLELCKPDTPLCKVDIPLCNEGLKLQLQTFEESEKNNVEEFDQEPSVSIRVESFGTSIVESIYDAYPRKVGKTVALNAIRKALGLISKRPELPDPVGWLQERVQAYAESRAGEEPRFTPHPATWFNSGRFDDDPAEWHRTRGNGTRSKSGVDLSVPLDAF